MSQPTVSQVHIDRMLTNLSVAYIQSEDNYVASQVFPVVSVDKRSDKYRTFVKGDWYRDEATKRAPGTESAGSGYGLGEGTYFCDPYAFHKDIDDQERANADDDIMLDRGATEFVTQRLLLKREKVWVATAFVTGVWGTEYQGVVSAPTTGQFIQFNDANSDPRLWVKKARRAMVSTTGIKPNTLVMHYDVLDALMDHPDFIERMKYTTPESVTEDMLAKIFGVERVIVGGAIENTAKEGQAPDVMDFVFGKHMLLCYVAPRPSLMTPSAGYTFSWDKYAPAPSKARQITIKRFRMEQIEAERIEGAMAFDDKIVAADMGVFFKDAVA